MSTNEGHVNQHFVIDDSGSMRPGAYGSKDLGRMEDVAAAVEAVVPDCLEEDKDGIDISFINNNKMITGVKVPSAASAFINSIEPAGGTGIGNRLKLLVDDYWDTFDPKTTNPKNFMIIGDGAASDREFLIKTIMECCIKALDKTDDPKKVTFSYLQVGHPSKLGDPETDEEGDRINDYKVECEKARKFLKELDDGLRNRFLRMLRNKATTDPKYKQYIAEIEKIDPEKIDKKKGLGRFDIVDTVPLDEKGSDLTANDVRKAMYGARYPELDKQKTGIRD